MQLTKGSSVLCLEKSTMEHNTKLRCNCDSSAESENRRNIPSQLKSKGHLLCQLWNFKSTSHHSWMQFRDPYVFREIQMVHSDERKKKEMGRSGKIALFAWLGPASLRKWNMTLFATMGLYLHPHKSQCVFIGKTFLFVFFFFFSALHFLPSTLKIVFS